MAELSEKYVKTSESHLLGEGKFVSFDMLCTYHEGRQMILQC